MGQTLYDKLWDMHVVHSDVEGNTLLYIDRHLVHEVTSPQAFEGLKLTDRKPWRTNAIVAVPDHNVPTTDHSAPIEDPISRLQVETLRKNCQENALVLFDINDIHQGIVHVIGPELGATLPGMTIVCGDSHTSTHGALGALAFGIGTSEVEHVLATQCLWQKKSKNFLIKVEGDLSPNVSAKDIVLYIIGQIGTAGGTGYTIEFAGSTIENLSVEGRMTLCNMAIEAGARAGLVAVDQKTLNYVKNRPFAPQDGSWHKAITIWKDLKSDLDAYFDRLAMFEASKIAPQVTWGTSPEMVIGIDARIPEPESFKEETKIKMAQRALEYMDLKPGIPISHISVDKIFIGSCTNARIEDLRAVAAIIKDNKIASNIKQALIVPGSGLVKKQAEAEGLHEIFLQAGFEWREPGCSMCLGMNPDQLQAKERCASTSNRNFEGRQGQGSRTHLVSPVMAAAAAIAGHFVDVRQW